MSLTNGEHRYPHKETCALNVGDPDKPTACDCGAYTRRANGAASRRGPEKAVRSYRAAIELTASREGIGLFKTKGVLDKRIREATEKLFSESAQARGDAPLAVALPITDSQKNRENKEDSYVHGGSLVSRLVVGQCLVNESVNESVNALRGESVSDSEIKERGVLSFFTKDEGLIYWRFQKHGKRRRGFNCLWGYMYDKARAGVKWVTPPVERLKQKLGCRSIQGVYHFLNYLEVIGVLESEPYDRKAGHKRIRWAIPTNIWKMANGAHDDDNDEEMPF
jgi:hypothetical protein